MATNLELASNVAAQSLEQHPKGTVTILDLLQAFVRQGTTAENFLQAYMGYREALLDLPQMTYYDFESQMPILKRYGIGTASAYLW